MGRFIAAPQRISGTLICRIAIVATFASAMAGCAHLRPTESWPDLVERLAPGKPVTVTTGSGREVAGRVSAISADSLTLTVNGLSQQFAANDVRQLRRNGDSLWNGLAIGAAFGVTAGAFGDARYYECGGPALCKDRQIPERLTFFAGATITGILIDRFHRDRRTLYRSPLTQTPKTEQATKN
jgi:hypothetical protein